VKPDLALLENLIEVARRNIAHQEQFVLRLHAQGQADLAEMAQEHLEKIVGDLEGLRELRRRVLSDLRHPRASSRQSAEETQPKQRYGS
jgi:hypothetical protein